MKKYFLFDCETGGKNPKTSLLTLYGMVLDSKLNIQDTINLKVKPSNGIYQVTAEALGVNKIDLFRHNQEAAAINVAAADFATFACKHSIGAYKLVPAGHNLSFDIGFVKGHFLQADNPEGDDWDKYFSHRRLDTATLAHGLILAGKLPNNLECSLQSLAQHFDLDYSGAHNAKFDAELTLDILKILISLM
jgi:DNA polymerase III alpha subunit (gram-positive type)